MFAPIYTALRASNTVVSLVDKKIYHRQAPQGTVAPYVVWSVFSDNPENNLSNLPPIDNQGIQIDIYHADEAGANTLAQAVRDAMEGVCHMTGLFGDERETDTKLHRIGLQFDYWLQR